MKYASIAAAMIAAAGLPTARAHAETFEQRDARERAMYCLQYRQSAYSVFDAVTFADRVPKDDTYFSIRGFLERSHMLPQGEYRFMIEEAQKEDRTGEDPGNSAAGFKTPRATAFADRMYERCLKLYPHAESPEDQEPNGSENGQGN